MTAKKQAGKKPPAKKPAAKKPGENEQAPGKEKKPKYVTCDIKVREDLIKDVELFAERLDKSPDEFFNECVQEHIKFLEANRVF